ncbi:MAG: hypothetical protein AAF518_27665 [Spirochaetota bacterium]
MKRTLMVLCAIFLLLSCGPKQNDSLQDEAFLFLAFQPLTFNISANITNGGTAVANSMVYFSQSTSTTTTSSSIQSSFSLRTATSTDTASSTSTDTATSTATDTSISTTSTTTGSAFATSATTDDSGNLSFTLSIGEYDAVITTTENKSMAFKIKIETSDALSTNKEGKATITYADGSVEVVVLSVSSSSTQPPSPLTFVCGYNPQGDTAPPELVSTELGASTLDLSSGSGTMQIKANLVDGNEGTDSAKAASGIKSVTARLFSPKRQSGSGYTAYATLTLNSETGLYEGDASIPDYVENGTWKLGSISSRDNAGNERTYILESSVSETNYAINGCGQQIDTKITAPEFVVSGSSPDTETPVIDTSSLVLKSEITGGATQDPISTDIDLSTSTSTPTEVTITVTVTATDGGGTGKASGVRYIDARLQSYSWWSASSNYLGNTAYIRLERTSGDNTNGTYTGSTTIYSFAEGNTSADGQWKVGGMWISDAVGNGQFYSRDTVNQGFTILNAATTATADFYAPELQAIETDKTEVAFDETFTISLTVADIATLTTSTDQTSVSTNTATSSSTDTASSTGTATATTTDTSTSTSTSSSSTEISGVRSVSALLYSPLKLLDDSLGVSKSVSLSLNATSGKYEGSSVFATANNEEGGTWKVAWIRVTDKAGNRRIYKLTEGYDYYTYINITRTDGDISGSFTETTITPIAITRN